MLEFQKNWNKMIWEQNQILIKALSFHECALQQPFMLCATMPFLLNLPTFLVLVIQNGLCFPNGNKS